VPRDVVRIGLTVCRPHHLAPRPSPQPHTDLSTARSTIGPRPHAPPSALQPARLPIGPQHLHALTIALLQLSTVVTGL
jgi:hypothetical protein